MADTKPRERKFETLFDGDEIDGKRYPLEAGVTGIDAPTAEFLLRNGRLAEVDDERFESLKSAYSDAENEAEPEGDTETDEERADRERLEAASEDFTAGRIPDDLVNPDASGDDKLVSRKDLDAIAKAESIETTSSMDKADVARAIMAGRAKASES